MSYLIVLTSLILMCNVENNQDIKPWIRYTKNWVVLYKWHGQIIIKGYSILYYLFYFS